MTLLLAGRKRKRGGRPPIALHWQEGNNPLPVRLLRAPRAPLSRFEQPHPWLATGPAAEPFDFCGHVRRLLVDIVARCAALAHVDVSRLLLGMTRSRNGRPHGLQARVTPLRLSPRDPRRIDGEQVQRYYLDHHEFYYLLTFVLPRFLDLDFSEKLITLFHELHHIGPRCDGDLRRYRGRCYAHSGSQKRYDRLVEALTDGWLRLGPPRAVYEFLEHDFRTLAARHGPIYGSKIPTPKLIPLD